MLIFLTLSHIGLCIFLVWCNIKATQRSHQYTFTAVFLTIGIFVLLIIATPPIWHDVVRLIYNIITVVVVILLLLYIGRVISGRIDRRNREK